MINIYEIAKKAGVSHTTISIDNIFNSDLLVPPLTTVAQKKYKMGYTAAEVLIDSLKKDKKPTKKIILEPQLIIRESCKKLDN